MSVLFINTTKRPLSHAAPHSHPYWEIVINTEGEGMTKIGDKEYPFKKGTVCIIPPNTLHEKTSNGEFKDIFLQADKMDIELPNEPVVFEDDEYGSLEKLMFIMFKSYWKREYNYHSTIDALWQACMQLMIGIINKNNYIPNEIELFTNYIISNYNKPDFRISTAALHSNYCIDHLRRLFKRYMNTTPMDYLLSLRIRCAKKLLISENFSSVRIISEKSGFSDYLYFTKVFKKMTGCTPTEYRKKNNI